jgi:hypothetical protein
MRGPHLEDVFDIIVIRISSKVTIPQGTGNIMLDMVKPRIIRSNMFFVFLDLLVNFCITFSKFSSKVVMQSSSNWGHINNPSDASLDTCREGR